jgi:hypothetical protein
MDAGRVSATAPVIVIGRRLVVDKGRKMYYCFDRVSRGIIQAEKESNMKISKIQEIRPGVGKTDRPRFKDAPR